MIFVFCFVEKMHFKLIMTSIYSMLRRSMKVELNRLEYSIRPQIFMHNERTFNVINVNFQCICEVFNNHICYLTIHGIEIESVESFKNVMINLVPIPSTNLKEPFFGRSCYFNVVIFGNRTFKHYILFKER
jgi:hypothetical protein